MSATRRLAYLCLQATREGQASHAHVHEIIAGLRRLGWQVDLFEPAYAGETGRVGLLRKLWAFIAVQMRLAGRAGSADALYVRWHPLAWPVALWARLRNKPTVQEVNGPDEDLFVSYPWTRRLAGVFRVFLRAPLRLAAGIIVVTPQLKDWLSPRLPAGKRICVIPNGANAQLFHPGRSRRSMRHGTEYVVFVGSLSVWQGVETMLRALEDPAWPQDVDLWVVGDGVERAKVEAASGCARLLYLGSRPYAEVPEIIATSLAGISPQTSPMGRSNTGLFPLKVFETMASGVPVVVSDYPGQADLVRDTQCGVVIPPGDPAALARAVRFLRDHPELRRSMGARGRRAVEELHSWDRRAEATADLLHSILDRR